MKLELMQFKGYTFPHNPQKLSILCGSNLKEIVVPKNGSTVQNLGNFRRQIKGVGEFCGANALGEFYKLFELYLQKEPGLLTIPDIPPFVAYFKTLFLTREPIENVAGYTFEFLEEDQTNATSETSKKTEKWHSVLSNEDLWSIAKLYQVDIENLVILNPDIKNPNNLAGTKEVRIC